MPGRPVMPAADAVAHIQRLLVGGDGTICGGAVAALREAAICPPHLVSHFEYAYSDVDVFNSSMTALSMNMQRMLDGGAVPLTPKDERIIARWKQRDTDGWKTNSVRLETMKGVEVNLVYKTIDNHPLRSALEQVSSFDFSHLGVSIDIATGERYDLGDYYWPNGQDRRYRMIPERERQWLNAQVGKFTGIRQADRYSRNVERLYDLEAAKQPLMLGYRITAEFYLEQDDEDLNRHGHLYRGIADLIEADDIDGLREMYKDLNPYSRVESLSDALKKVKGSP